MTLSPSQKVVGPSVVIGKAAGLGLMVTLIGSEGGLSQPFVLVTIQEKLPVTSAVISCVVSPFLGHPPSDS